MDKDRLTGSARQVKGSVEEAVGKVTGDTKTEAEGKAEKTAGKAQNCKNRGKPAPDFGRKRQVISAESGT